MTTTPAAAAIVDQLGFIQAQIADLAKIEASLKSQLKAGGAGAYDGDLFRATVSESVRETLDATAAREKLLELGVSHQWFTAHTKTSPVVTVRVTARSAAAARHVAAA